VFFHKGVKEFEARWIGWAGVNVMDAVGQKSLSDALAEKVPYFLDHNGRNNFCICHCDVTSVVFIFKKFCLFVTCVTEVYPSISY
jgi:hypothetical protein